MFDDFKGEVVFRCASVELQFLKREARQTQNPLWCILENKHHLKQRRMNQATFGIDHLDKLFERQILILVGFEHALSSACDEFEERRVAGQISADHQRAGEKAD